MDNPVRGNIWSEEAEDNQNIDFRQDLHRKFSEGVQQELERVIISQDMEINEKTKRIKEVETMLN
jgi:hypothetical protein